jgi:hypothetical protein
MMLGEGLGPPVVPFHLPGGRPARPAGHLAGSAIAEHIPYSIATACPPRLAGWWICDQGAAARELLSLIVKLR